MSSLQSLIRDKLPPPPPPPPTRLPLTKGISNEGAGKGGEGEAGVGE